MSLNIPSRKLKYLLLLSVAISVGIQLHLAISVAVTINEAAAQVMEIAALVPTHLSAK